MVFVSPSWVPTIAGESIPDTVPVSQFVLDEQYGRCRLAESRPPFICISGKRYSSAEVRQRVDNLSRAFAKEFSWSPNKGSEWDKVVAIYALNAVTHAHNRPLVQRHVC
jgi:ribosome assembly protein SQT1